MSSLSSRPPSASPPFVRCPPAAFRTAAASACPPGPDVPHSAGADVAHSAGADVPHSAGADVPPTCEVPYFAPVRVRAGLLRPGRLAAHRRRAVAAGLAVTAAALVAAGPRETDESRDRPDESAAARPAAAANAEVVRKRRSGAYVMAPVRIADAATVRLLRPGDRVDVIAAEERPAGGEARVLARGARVTDVPDDPLHDADGTEGTEGTGGGADAMSGGVNGGALVVLSVPRATAAALVGASSTARLAVTLC